MRFAREYRPAIRIALLQEIPLLALASLILDGGGMFRVLSVAVLSHWAAILFILGRRPRSPTRLDLALIRFGFWSMPIIIGMVAPIVWRLTGQERLP